MPQGIEIFNSSGQTVMNTSDLLTRVITTINVTQDGSYTLPFEAGARYAAYIVAGAPTSRADSVPILNINGLTLSWELWGYVNSNNTIVVVRY